MEGWKMKETRRDIRSRWKHYNGLKVDRKSATFFERENDD